MESIIETININGEDYAKVSDLEKFEKTEHIEWTGEKTIQSIMIGKPVIVRSRNEGINAGIVVLADDTGVELKDCRRIWYHKPKDKNLSWYEGVAESGISEDSKVSGTVKRKIIIEDYSMTECNANAFKSIMELKPNGQN